MEEQLSRIAQAFERIADSFERIEAEGLGVHATLNDGSLIVRHEFEEQEVLKIHIADIEQLNDQFFHVKVHK